VWGPEGELFYTSPAGGTRMMAVQIDLESGTPGIPQALFDGSPYLLASPRNYDVTPDGQLFLVVKPRPNAEPREVIRGVEAVGADGEVKGRAERGKKADTSG
jgi:hypothetical protein